MKIVLLINVKMPTIVGILTFINRINATSKCFKAGNISTYILVKFSMKKSFTNSGSNLFRPWVTKLFHALLGMKFIKLINCWHFHIYKLDKYCIFAYVLDVQNNRCFEYETTYILVEKGEN